MSIFLLVIGNKGKPIMKKSIGKFIAISAMAAQACLADGSNQFIHMTVEGTFASDSGGKELVDIRFNPYRGLLKLGSNGVDKDSICARIKAYDTDSMWIGTSKVLMFDTFYKDVHFIDTANAKYVKYFEVELMRKADAPLDTFEITLAVNQMLRDFDEGKKVDLNAIAELEKETNIDDKDRDRLSKLRKSIKAKKTAAQKAKETKAKIDNALLDLDNPENRRFLRNNGYKISVSDEGKYVATKTKGDNK